MYFKLFHERMKIKEALGVLQGSFKGIPKDFSEKFQRCFKEVFRVFQGSFKGVSRMFQGI